MLATMPEVTALLIHDRRRELLRQADEDRTARLAGGAASAWAARWLPWRARAVPATAPAVRTPARGFVAPPDWGAPRTGGVTFHAS